jgi:hypothetical protein
LVIFTLEGGWSGWCWRLSGGLSCAGSVRYRDAGASISEISRETSLNWRTVKRYLENDGPAAPPAAAPRRSRRGQLIDAYAHVIDEWLRAELLLKAPVIYERLVADYGFTGHYQRVKMYLQEARPKIAEELGYTPSELARLHRRFEVVPGAQARWCG